MLISPKAGANYSFSTHLQVSEFLAVCDEGVKAWVFDIFYNSTISKLLRGSWEVLG